MFEDEDAILPDDYEATPAEGVEVEEETIEPAGEDTKPPVETIEPVQETPKLKIKYNHEEKEISLEEAATLAQKGLNYDKGIERARQEAVDEAYASLGYTWNGKPISTKAQYDQAKAEEKAYNDIMALAAKEGVPEEFAERMYKLEQKEAEREKESTRTRQEQEEKARQGAEGSHFLDLFEEEHGRPYDSKKDEIPQEVRESTKSLPVAYLEYLTKQHRSQLKVMKQNESNKQRAPIGSVTAHGSNEVAGEDDFLKGFNSV